MEWKQFSVAQAEKLLFGIEVSFHCETTELYNIFTPRLGDRTLSLFFIFTMVKFFNFKQEHNPLVPGVH